ncbi:hypothetical protein FRC14_006416 [Serendipita sp. 396]|nr:hypothetical protein FRC14_006416 [Serendipita sp. 396]KAG8777840.1 hypothetical protein FRC15_011096 [Serendipita sp. 397]KAG8861071.1 hypothetical protein FRC20_011530 [Serendipita sp. 405]
MPNKVSFQNTTFTLKLGSTVDSMSFSSSSNKYAANPQKSYTASAVFQSISTYAGSNIRQYVPDPNNHWNPDTRDVGSTAEFSFITANVIQMTYNNGDSISFVSS